LHPFRPVFALAAVLALAGAARADTRLVLVRVQQLAALEPVLVFGDGYHVYTEPLRRVPYLTTDPAAILVLDPDTRRISVADAALASLVLGSTTLGALLDQTGAAVAVCVPPDGDPSRDRCIATGPRRRGRPSTSDPVRIPAPVPPACVASRRSAATSRSTSCSTRATSRSTARTSPTPREPHGRRRPSRAAPSSDAARRTATSPTSRCCAAISRAFRRACRRSAAQRPQALRQGPGTGWRAQVEVLVGEKISRLAATRSLTLHCPSLFPSHSGVAWPGLKIATLIAIRSETLLRPSPF
jgi:hypothetical protein